MDGSPGWRRGDRSPASGFARKKPFSASCRCAPGGRNRRPGAVRARASCQGRWGIGFGCAPWYQWYMCSSSMHRACAGSPVPISHGKWRTTIWPGARPPFLIQVVCCETREKPTDAEASARMASSYRKRLRWRDDGTVRPASGRDRRGSRSPAGHSGRSAGLAPGTVRQFHADQPPRICRHLPGHAGHAARGCTDVRREPDRSRGGVRILPAPAKCPGV